MEIPIEYPLDADGFLRRECPNCEREFKWHHGQTESAPTGYVYPDLYFCPRCGKAAGDDSWWTAEQIAYQREVAQRAAHSALGDLLKDTFGSNRPNSMIKFEVEHSSDPSEPHSLSLIHI